MPSSNDPVTAAATRLFAAGDAVVALAVVAVANLEPAVHGTSASHGQVAAAPAEGQGKVKGRSGRGGVAREAENG